MKLDSIRTSPQEVPSRSNGQKRLARPLDSALRISLTDVGGDSRLIEMSSGQHDSGNQSQGAKE